MTPTEQRRTIVLFVLFSSLLFVSRGQEAEPPPTQSETVERSGVSLLLLDVVVTDKKGAPIRGLTREDFAVQLNGREWPIYSLDDLCGDQAPTPLPDGPELGESTAAESPTAPEVPTSAPAPVAGETRFVLYFDFSQLQLDGRNRAFEAARRWIRETKRSDERASVVGYSVLTGVRVLCPFTTDGTELLAALDAAESNPELIDTFAPQVRDRLDECLPCVAAKCGGSPWCTPYDPCWVCCPVCLQFAQREQAHGLRSLGALQIYLETLETVHGRKALLLFQQNSMAYPGRLYVVHEFKSGDHVSLMDRVGAEATLANAAIYSAAVGDPLGPDPVVKASVNFGANLAEFTGGDYGRGLTDLAGFLDRAGREEACVYRIGLRQHEAPSGVPMRAKVWVRDKPLRHRYRVQFLDEVDRWWRVARAALRDPDGYTDVGVTAAVVPVARTDKGWDLSVQVAVDAETLTLLPSGEGQGAEWEVGALLSRNDGARNWEMLAKSQLRAGADTTVGTILHERLISGLGPGAYRLGAFVRDITGNTFGAAEATLEIPAAEEGTVVGPILLGADRSHVTSPLPLLSTKDVGATHTVERSSGAVPVDRRAIARGDSLQIEAWVCGELDGEPARFVSASDETLLRFDEEATATAGSCRQLVDRVETLSLEPGRYTYHLQVPGPAAADPIQTEVSIDVIGHGVEPTEADLLESPAVESAALAVEPTAPAPEPPMDPAVQKQLEGILRRLANVAKLYRDNALRFTCDETIHFSGRGEPVLHRFQYLYRYSDEEHALRDYRRFLSGKPEIVDLEKIGLPVYLLRAYSWAFIFLDEIQPTYRFRLEEDDEALGRPAYRISFAPIPPFELNVNDWFGTIWVDRESYQLLQVEASRPEDQEQRRLMERAANEARQSSKSNYRGSFGLSTYRTEFDIEKNGMRFPGRVTIQHTEHVVYGGTGRGRSRARPVYHVTQTYKKYRFFGVRTTEEIRSIVDGAD